MPRVRAVLDQLNIVVRDMDAAVAFYRRLGLEIPDTLPQWQADHRTADAGGSIDLDLDSTAFAQRWNAGWPNSQPGVVVGFRVATRQDVDDLYAELTAAGHVGQQAPCDAFWGARYAVVEDPSGNAVGLMSPVDPARRRPPPAPP
jgi:catechol 2,3-dioxygenase-like lactoylglutathione lyase family enzyme